MCQHVNLALEGYEVVPCGSHSMIRVIEPGKKVVEYRLHGKGSWKPFGDDQLDNGIVAYVRCFGQLEARLKERFPNRVSFLFQFVSASIFKLMGTLNVLYAF